jgi:hypothetical protein
MAAAAPGKTAPAVARAETGRVRQALPNDGERSRDRSAPSERNDSATMADNSDDDPLSGKRRRDWVRANTLCMGSVRRLEIGLAGVEFEVAEAFLAHAIGNSVTRAYLRSSMVERRRKVMADWAAFLVGQDPKRKPD